MTIMRDVFVLEGDIITKHYSSSIAKLLLRLLSHAFPFLLLSIYRSLKFWERSLAFFLTNTFLPTHKPDTRGL